MRNFQVSKKSELLSFLFQALSDTKKTRVRQALKFGSVTVNGRVVTQFNHALRPGDKISIDRPSRAVRTPEPLFDVKIIYEDEAILVADKPSGLLTIATEKIKMHTAFYAVSQHLKQTAAPERQKAFPNSRKNLFLVHRLDKETSGLLVFAKSAADKEDLQNQWREKFVQKKYFAVVEGVPKEKTGTIRSFLRENKFLRVYTTNRREMGEEAVTHYSVVRSTPSHSLVEVAIETGRKHQIRVHFSEMGHPVAGDRFYGAKTDPAGRLALHAFELIFRHPVSGKKVRFESPLPGKLGNIMKETKP